MVAEDFVRSEFKPWETGDPILFFDKLPDNISWTVSGKLNPLSGHYTSKSDVLAIFGRLTSKLAGPPVCKITNILTSKDYAVVEMDFHSVSKGGNNYDQSLCWVCRYEGTTCVEVRLYVDTAGEVALFEEP
jgi:uncharacterized protein